MGSLQTLCCKFTGESDSEKNFENHQEIRGKRDNARNNAKCTQARKTTYGLGGQHQNVDRTSRGRVNQNDRRQREMDKVRIWCGQPSDRGRLKNRTEQTAMSLLSPFLEQGVQLGESALG